jgi:hypothetical protein
MDADDLTAEGMVSGVAQSDVYVLFLSEGVLSRAFVQLEIREALRLGKKIVTIFETDDRYSLLIVQSINSAVY